MSEFHISSLPYTVNSKSTPKHSLTCSNNEMPSVRTGSHYF